MGKKTVEDLIIKKIDNLEAKIDYLASERIPNMLVDVAKIAQSAKDEAKQQTAVENKATRIWAGLAGGLTLILSVVSIAIAYFK